MAKFKDLIVNGTTRFLGNVFAKKFVGDVEGNCSGSAGSVEWGNVNNKPTIEDSTYSGKELYEITDISVLEGNNVGYISTYTGNSSDGSYNVIVPNLCIYERTENRDGHDYKIYTINPGTIIYVCNTVDASEDSVGYYRCIKSITDDLSYMISYELTQYAYDTNTLEYFEYLGKSLLCQGLSLQASASVLMQNVSTLSTDVASINEQVTNFNTYLLPVNITNDSSTELKNLFNFYDLSTSSFSVSGPMVMLNDTNALSKLVYLSSGKSFSFTAYTQSNGSYPSAYLPKGYYKFNTTYVATLNPSSHTVTYNMTYYGETLQIPCKV